MKNKFNYYYSNEAEQFNFYRIPKVLFTDKRFSKLSVEAKVLYGLLLDRMSLSIKNNWIDEDNRVYIYFKLEDVQEFMCVGKDKCIKLFSELEKGIGLIERKKQGQGKPALIYVLNFNTSDTQELQNSENQTSEFQSSENPTSENDENTEVLTSEIPTSGLLKNRTQEFGKTDSNNTNINKTEYSNINLINKIKNYQKENDTKSLYVIILIIMFLYKNTVLIK